ncbi:MAG: pullulanase [Candidatus Marinimicrobia bacterium]|nr:pullulanase [Candidatus Neomarinimicrobiota bacterium]MCF7850818.1 pullulanase [Candidatus Neomarinimicrobiota bacterium]MCF7905374.1 pullulanase [Candidatus Neomarinimicrobiota bacterium]
MKTIKWVVSLLMIVMISACTNISEIKNKMIDKAPINAVDETLGLNREGGHYAFRIFAPSLDDLQLVLFERYDDMEGSSYPMTKKSNGVWEIHLPKAEVKGYYGYRTSSQGDRVIADPYSQAVVRLNNYQYSSKTVILSDEPFDWEGAEYTHTALKDLVILEAHLRDMSVHPNSEATQAGTYKGFVETDQRGGINHLEDMGYNAVEFLPLHEFGNIEIDFKNEDLSPFNDWNPYETNHWGYMTSFFFAPEVYYASDGSSERETWVGIDGRAVNEMKTMVKALHKEGITVILDVVYNHVSQYDENPFKMIDKEAYFRLDEDGDYLGHSGCGNDFRTEHPMARKMIVESLLYWMNEYKIDGFRFDLAAMIDMETIDAITEATQALNPDVLLIGEPWGGGGYNPSELADHGWASWNDHFRNSVKGRSPENEDYGFIFGKLWDGNNTAHYKKLMRGYLQNEGGHYTQPEQSVNYLESHDDHTLGDFVRHALEIVGRDEVVTREQVVKLSEPELKAHKLAAITLLSAQGPIMLAQGQSWGRSKVIANSIGTDPNAGKLDHNSYEKDDETNWLDWDEKDLNSELVDYYRGLIAIRHQRPELRAVEIGTRTFIDSKNEMSFGFSIIGEKQVLVLLNGDKVDAVKYDLPSGTWEVLANADQAGLNVIDHLSGQISVPAQSGLILVK